MLDVRGAQVFLCSRDNPSALTAFASHRRGSHLNLSAGSCFQARLRMTAGPFSTRPFSRANRELCNGHTMLSAGGPGFQSFCLSLTTPSLLSRAPTQQSAFGPRDIPDARPEVELELWKFISFPVSGRQFLLISGSTSPCGA